MSVVFAKKQIPVIMLAVIILLMIIPFFVTFEPLSAANAEIQRYIVGIAALTTILGAVGMLSMHGARVKHKSAGWPLNVLQIVTFLFFLVITLVPSLEGVLTATYTPIIGALTEVIFSMVALFMISMAWRAFRMRTTEGIMFTISCLLILIANAPSSDVLLWVGLPGVRDWVMNVPSMAALRAVVIGVALALIAYGVRAMLGYERTILGER